MPIHNRQQTEKIPAGIDDDTIKDFQQPPPAKADKGDFKTSLTEKRKIRPKKKNRNKYVAK